MLLRPLMASQIQSVRWAFNCGSWFPTEEDWQLLSSGIDVDDKKEVGKFVFQKDAKSAMVGRYLTRKFISEATNLAWRDVKVLRDSTYKKPYFPQELFPNFGIKFNVSHSGDFVILAGEVGDLQLGVDLMKIETQRTTPVPEFLNLMSKQFAKEEWDIIKSQRTEAEQMAMFYRFWCLKESYTKATGTGITVDLKRICFKLRNFKLSESAVVNDTEVFVNSKKQDGWKFEESLINSKHIATVACYYTDNILKQPADAQIFRTLLFPELISEYQQISQIDCDYSRQFMAKRKLP